MSVENLIPTRGWLLVKKVEASQTASGLFVVNTANQTGLLTGEIVNRGEEELLHNGDPVGVDFSTGDQILYLKGTPVPFDRDHVLVRHQDVLAFTVKS